MPVTLSGHALQDWAEAPLLLCADDPTEMSSTKLDLLIEGGSKAHEFHKKTDGAPEAHLYFCGGLA